MVAWLQTGAPDRTTGRAIVKDNRSEGQIVGRRRSRSRTEPPAPSDPELVQSLTRRELEILGLVASGRRSQSIADELGIALPTVKRHLANIYEKLGTANRVQASNLYHLSQGTYGKRPVRRAS
jgi:DNA-binding CsgD family transcriptional regulator